MSHRFRLSFFTQARIMKVATKTATQKTPTSPPIVAATITPAQPPPKKTHAAAANPPTAKASPIKKLTIPLNLLKKTKKKSAASKKKKGVDGINFELYIRRLQKSAGHCGIRPAAVSILNNVIISATKRIGELSADLARLNKKKTILATHIEAAMQMVLN